MLPENVILDIVDLSDIPFLNEDVEREGLPEPVKKLKAALAKADAFLIATPEYNYSIPPVLKNAIDWASRGNETPLDGKPLAIMSASMSSLGGAGCSSFKTSMCLP